MRCEKPQLASFRKKGVDACQPAARPFVKIEPSLGLLEEPIPVATSIRRCNLGLLNLDGLLHLLHNLLNRGLGSLDGLRCLGRSWLLKNCLLNLNSRGGGGLLFSRGGGLLLLGHHGVAVLLGAVGRVHWRCTVAGGGVGGSVHHRGVVDQGCSMVDNRGMMDNRCVVDNGSVVNDRGRGISRGNGGGNLDNWSRGNNRCNLNHRGRSNNNRGSCNLDQRSSLVSRCRLRWVLCLSLVGDGCVVALRPGGVGDDLDAAVGKVDAIFSAGVGSVSLLGLGEDGVAVALVVHSILIIVDGGEIRIGLNRDRGSNGILWPTSGKSKQSCEEHQLGHDEGGRVQGGEVEGVLAQWQKQAVLRR